MKSSLTDFDLWYDGTVELSPAQLPKYLMSGGDISSVAFSESTAEIQELIRSLPISVRPPEVGKRKNRELDRSWNLPHKYQTIDVLALVESLSEGESEEGKLRLVQEYLLFEYYGVLDVIKCIQYVIDRMKECGQVWGVGRGSSGASYLLYKMGLHCVNPLEWDIPITEFFKEVPDHLNLSHK